jgi:hypothetical protein
MIGLGLFDARLIEHRRIDLATESWQTSHR